MTKLISLSPRVLFTSAGGALLALTAVAGCQVGLGGILRPGSAGSAPRGAPSGSNEPTPGLGDGGGADDDGGAPAVAPAARGLDYSNETVVTIDPAPGVARVAATRPAWCNGVAAAATERAAARAPFRSMTQMKERGWWWGENANYLQAACADPDEPKVQEQTGHFLQLWVNALGVEPAALVPFFRRFASPEAYHADLDGACASLAIDPEPRSGVGERSEPLGATPAERPRVKIDPEAGERERALAEVERATLGCARDAAPFWLTREHRVDVAWLLDRDAAPPSELVRSYAVLSCLDTRGDKPIDDRALAAYAVCRHDAGALDEAQLALDVAGGSELVRLIAGQQHARARLVAARYETEAQARIGKDAGWKALFERGEAAWKGWSADAAGQRKALDAAHGYEARYQAGGAEARGCWAEAWGNLSRYVAGRKATTVLAARAAITDAIGGVLGVYAATCAAAEGDTWLAGQLSSLLKIARPARGPRLAAYFATLDALGEIRAERPRFPVELDWLRGLPLVPTSNPALARLGIGYVGFDVSGGDKGGVVASVSRVDDGVLVEFKTERWKELVNECESTGEILMWDGTGAPIYRTRCQDAGTKTVEQTHDPLWIPASLAAGIAPGTFVRSLSDLPHPGVDASKALALEVWASKERRRLVAYLGIEL